LIYSLLLKAGRGDQSVALNRMVLVIITFVADKYGLNLSRNGNDRCIGGRSMGAFTPVTRMTPGRV
jgi:hypothetical protein